jgi:hypothetical protein
MTAELWGSVTVGWNAKWYYCYRYSYRLDFLVAVKTHHGRWTLEWASSCGQ